MMKEYHLKKKKKRKCCKIRAASEKMEMIFPFWKMESFVFPEDKGQERRLRTFKNVVLDPYSMRQKIPRQTQLKF